MPIWSYGLPARGNFFTDLLIVSNELFALNYSVFIQLRLACSLQNKILLRGRSVLRSKPLPFDIKVTCSEYSSLQNGTPFIKIIHTYIVDKGEIKHILANNQLTFSKLFNFFTEVIPYNTWMYHAAVIGASTFSIKQ